jgi:uncharacterized protein
MGVRRVEKTAGVLLTPGAGSSADHPGLLAIETALQKAHPHVLVQRMDFPYRKAGRRAPDRAPVLLAAVQHGVAELKSSLPAGAPLLIGGRSMGGRMCSMAIAEGHLDGLNVNGLMCFSYPLHPPGRPDKLRIDHLPRITVPSLFVSGTKDTFGTPDELREHLSTVSGPTTLVFLEGVGHDLKRAEAEVAERVVQWSSLVLPTSG